LFGTLRSSRSFGYNPEVRFEWDSEKAIANLRKHKVSFDEATTVFRDPLAVIFDDEDHAAEERREIIIGHSLANRLVLVCFTEREQKCARIFSARQLTRTERKDYEERRRF
jgi:uncharacterized DUF497 family protein